jgi:nitroreductase
MTDNGDKSELAGLGEVIRNRHSERVPFDPERQLAEVELQAILEAARWAPTAHNMQNFEIIVVDDKSTLEAIGRVRGGTSKDFIRENYAQLSFSEEELIQKGTGLLATMFPPSWRDPDGGIEQATDVEHGFLDETMRSCPLVMILVYDPRKRAPASEGDFLGIMMPGVRDAEHVADGRDAGDRDANHERLQRTTRRGGTAQDPGDSRPPQHCLRVPPGVRGSRTRSTPARSAPDRALHASQYIRSSQMMIESTLLSMARGRSQPRG